MRIYTGMNGRVGFLVSSAVTNTTSSRLGTGSDFLLVLGGASGAESPLTSEESSSSSSLHSSSTSGVVVAVPRKVLLTVSTPSQFTFVGWGGRGGGGGGLESLLETGGGLSLATGGEGSYTIKG